MQPLIQSLDDHPRAMPRWRAKQRALPVREKIGLLGQVIIETRHLESVKKSCKQFATPSNDCLAKGS